MRTMLIAVLGLVVAGGGMASAAVCGDPPYEEHCIINNGLAPPTPQNVINDDTFVDSYAYVRNINCPPAWPTSSYAWDDCSSPGAPTEAVLVDGGAVGWDLRVYDSSIVTMNGGTVTGFLHANDSSMITMNGGTLENNMQARDFSTVVMNGGTALRRLQAMASSTVTINDGAVTGALEAFGSSTVTMNGGTTGSSLGAFDSSTVTMNGGTLGDVLGAANTGTILMNGGTVWGLHSWGSSTITISGGRVTGDLTSSHSSTTTIVGRYFAVDGHPVPYGDLTAQTGILTGMLASGDPLNNLFAQGGCTEYPCSVQYPCDGTITLVEAPQLPTLSPWFQVALMAALLGARLGVWRSRGA